MVSPSPDGLHPTFLVLLTDFSPLAFLATLEPWMQALFGMAVLLLAAIALRLLALWVLKPVLRRVRQRASAWPTEILLHDAVLSLIHI